MESIEASFSELTTLRVGGRIADFRLVDSPEELAACVREADAAGTPLIVLGCGSNLLAGDADFPGMVVKARDGKGPQTVEREGTAHVSVNAGCVWDDFVAWCVTHGLEGLEALSGIPGQIGSAVMQNLGAYGQEIGTRLEAATLLDRLTGKVERYAKDELGLGYRTSILRKSMDEGQDGGRWALSPRWIVLSAEFELTKAQQGCVGHAQLAKALGCEVGQRMSIEMIREKVHEVRASKGMVCDPDPCGPSPIHDRWSSGSFFTNPVLGSEEAAELLPEDAPRYPAHDAQHVKTSAAWLIDHAGFPKGYGVHGGESKASLSNLHTLALTNRGQATSADVVELAQTVKDGVRERFGIELKPETVLVGVSLN